MTNITEKIDKYLTQNTLNEGVYDPGIFKAVFLAGGPGSGKSFVSSKVTGGMGLKVVNSDTLFEILGKQKGIDLKTMPDSEKEARDKVRSIAKELTNKQHKNYINGRLGLVIDGTGRKVKKIKDQQEKLKLLGYDTYMVFVNTSLDVALERNIKRKRSVPEKIVRKAWQDVQNNMGGFQTIFKSSNFSIVDNNVYSTDKNLFIDAWKEVKKFVKRPIENHIAKQWINIEMEKKKDKK